MKLFIRQKSVALPRRSVIRIAKPARGAALQNVYEEHFQGRSLSFAAAAAEYKLRGSAASTQ
jgi:hypothetical protein